ncbi:MAG: response regulator [Lachnospiraceae bacterium]
MKNYSVLLVDDEEDVIAVIRKKMNWEELGFEVIGYAQNGIEALEIAENQTVDVVLTDIKMPYMDGLTMAKQMKELNPGVKIIIFSGFDEFEYAKEAIEVEAEKYILKPVNITELTDVFSRIKTELDREQDERKNLQQLLSYYEKSLPLLQENFWISLLSGSIPARQIERYRQTYQIQVSANYYVVSVLHVSTVQSEEETVLDPMMAMVAVRQFAEEKLSGKFRCMFLNYLRDLVVIAFFEQKDEIAGYTNALDRLCKMAWRSCGVKVTAGIGYECSQLDQLPFSYEGAKNAASYRFFYGSMRAINIVDVDPQQATELNWESSYIEAIMRSMKFRKEDAVEEDIDAFVNRLSESGMSMQQYRIVLMELVTELLRFTTSNRLDTVGILPQGVDAYDEILQLDSSGELKNWLMKRCLVLQKQIQEKKSNYSKSFVDKAIDYIKEKYANPDLTLDLICSHLGVSTAHFSTVFKKETGKTFVNYLTDYRMEIAAKSLLDKDEKTYMIASQVGYSDPNYFSYVFKRKYGVSPSKYRAFVQENS